MNECLKTTFVNEMSCKGSGLIKEFLLAIQDTLLKSVAQRNVRSTRAVWNPVLSLSIRRGM